MKTKPVASRKKIWTEEEVRKRIDPLLEMRWSMTQISRTLGVSRQRLYTILKENKRGIYSHNSNDQKD